MQIRHDVDIDTMTCMGALGLLVCLWRIAANEYHQNNTNSYKHDEYFTN